MAFGSTELGQYLVAQNITGTRAEYIRAASEGMSRDVRPSSNESCVVEYQSMKMGVTVNTESRTAEFVYALHLEYDDSLVAYFEQPPEVDVRRYTQPGYRRTASYHPDFLLLRTDGPQVIQVKPLDELEKLAASDKNWLKQADGSFQDIPAQEAFAAKGLPHFVFAVDRSDQQRAANIALLLQALRHPVEVRALADRVAEHMDKHGLLPLAELSRELDQKDLTPFFGLIANHRIHTNIAKYSLAHADTCLVAREPAMLEEIYVQAWNQLRLDYQCKLTGSGSQADLPLEKHLKAALSKLKELEAGRNDRTARRWRKKIQKAELEGISAVVALSREYKSRGNRNPKRPQQVALAIEHIKSQWVGKETPAPRALYRRFKSDAEKAFPDSKPLSSKSFYAQLELLKAPLAQRRGGNRAGNAAHPPTDVKHRALKPERPFELATCDHYLCDQYCTVMVSNGFEYAMRPWLTALRDIGTTSLLAFWLRLSAPSRRSISLVLRQCLRTHGRLPENIIEDGGSDFQSVFNSALAAHCRFNLVFRPTGAPRYGSEAEGFFKQYKELWLSSRPGNLVNLKEVRSVSSSHRPEKRATMSLFEMWQDLLEFGNWMGHHTTDSAVASPAARLQIGLERFSCSGVKVAYDDTFVIATAVDTSEYKLDRQRGLHIGAFHYWSPELGGETRTRIPVRIDPQDPYRVYALTAGRWVTCLASPAPSYSKQTPLQQIVEGVIQLDGRELRKAIRDDGDRLLVQAIVRRDAACASAMSQDGCPPAPPMPRQNIDPFAELTNEHLPELVESSW